MSRLARTGRDWASVAGAVFVCRGRCLDSVGVNAGARAAHHLAAVVPACPPGTAERRCGLRCRGTAENCRTARANAAVPQTPLRKYRTAHHALRQNSASAPRGETQPAARSCRIRRVIATRSGCRPSADWCTGGSPRWTSSARERTTLRPSPWRRCSSRQPAVSGLARRGREGPSGCQTCRPGGVCRTPGRAEGRIIGSGGGADGSDRRRGARFALCGPAGTTSCLRALPICKARPVPGGADRSLMVG